MTTRRCYKCDGNMHRFKAVMFHKEVCGWSCEKCGRLVFDKKNKNKKATKKEVRHENKA